MSKTATTATTAVTEAAGPAGAARRTGVIPAQTGPQDAPDGTPDGTEPRLVTPGADAAGTTRPAGPDRPGDRAAGDAGSAGSGAHGASAPGGPAGAGEGDAGAGRAGSGLGPVIPGAGPVMDPGERPTVRLREDGPEEPPRYAPEWLELREPVDARSRALDLLDPLRIRLANLPVRGGLLVHDLGCGTGSMGRWLAPRLDGAQHWVLHDRDPYLLHFAAVSSPRVSADGSRVSVETRRGDVVRLTADAFTGACLVTASALLDVLTRDEVEVLAEACTAAGCPALLTLSVAGRVELDPALPLDREIAEAFNDHQRRGGLLGPDAVDAACEAFTERGATVRLSASPWRLGPDDAALTAQWLRGWVGAAVEQRPELREPAEEYLRARLRACEAGELRVVVHHTDLLALSRPSGATTPGGADRASGTHPGGGPA